MKTQFEITNNQGVIYSGTFKEVMHYWDLIIGMTKPLTKKERAFYKLYKNTDLTLIPTN